MALPLPGVSRGGGQFLPALRIAQVRRPPPRLTLALSLTFTLTLTLTLTAWQFEESTCSRGGYCNFMHLKKVSSKLQRRLLAKVEDRTYPTP